MTDRILCSIYPHEQEAMLKLVQMARGMATAFDGKPSPDSYSVKLRVWAQMVEDVLERIEQEEIA